MAEANTWQNIKEFGLLSTSAILDLHKIDDDNRVKYESMHRPDMVSILSKNAPKMILRDQKPMSDARLEIALNGSSTPREWYELLNRRVFLWATKDRLLTLLSARHYRSVFHDVLTVDCASFAKDYHKKIELCHMNSGNTFPIPHHRTSCIFQSIDDYPAKPSGFPIKEVAEVTVPHRIPNILDYVIRVDSYKGPDLSRVIYERN